MNAHDDPPRLKEADSNASTALRLMLDSARDDAPTAADAARVGTAILSRAHGRASGLERTARFGGPLGKLALAALGAAIVGVLVILFRQSERTVEHGIGQRHVVAEAPSLPPVLAPAPSPAPPAPALSPPVTQSVTPVAVPAGEPTRPTRVRPRPTPTQAPAANDTRTPSVDELTLLGDARHAVRSADYARALVLIAQHERRFPGGMLAEEREALRIEATWRTGQSVAARQRLDTFERTYPASPYSTRLRALVHD